MEHSIEAYSIAHSKDDSFRHYTKNKLKYVYVIGFSALSILLAHNNGN